MQPVTITNQAALAMNIVPTIHLTPPHLRTTRKYGPPAPLIPVDSATNRVTGYTYDSSGNVLNDLNHTYAYDAGGRLLSVDNGSTAVYLYDYSGKRVKAGNNGSSADYIYLGTLLIAEYSSGGALIREHVYFGGQRVATIAVNGAPIYNHRDHLSLRLQTDQSGNILGKHTHFPFGETWENTLPSGEGNLFTTYQRESETGLDYAVNRRYSSSIGRFYSPDPVGTAVADPANPQSWNLYSYVLNDPVDFTDPLGTYIAVWIDGCLWLWHDMEGSGRDPWENLGCVGGSDLGHLKDPVNDGEKGGGGGGDAKKKYGKCLANVQKFVNDHLADAQKLANEMGNGVTANEVLATAGNETGWGGGFAEYGNYFGLHGNGPAGTYYTTKNQTPIQKFPKGQDGFLLSGQVAVNMVTPYLSPGMGNDPLQFFTILNEHGFATGNPGYPAMMMQNDAKKRGPYTLVLACTGS